MIKIFFAMPVPCHVFDPMVNSTSWHISVCVKLILGYYYRFLGEHTSISYIE